MAQGARTELFSRKIPGGLYVIHNVDAHTGNIFFVDSGNTDTGADSVGSGRGPDQPFLTLDYAVGQCTANNGDVIYVLPGHNEAVSEAAGLALDVEGITIYFLGKGGDQAKVTFGTDVGADMDVDAANITLVNPKFVAGIDALTGPIDINAVDCTIINGEYHDATDIDTTDCIVVDNASTRLKIHGWKYYMGNEGGTQKQSNIQLNGTDDAELFDIDIRGDFGTGNIENVTDEVLNVRMRHIYLENTNSSPVPGIFLDAAATGEAHDVRIKIASGTTYTSNVGLLGWSQSYGTGDNGYDIADPIGTVETSGVEGKVDVVDGYHDVPDADTSANSQMRDVIGNKIDAARSGVVGTTASLVAYAKQIVTNSLVAAADSTANAQLNQVVGNKTDHSRSGTVGTTASLVSYAKQLVVNSLVAAANSTANAQMNQVVGNKADNSRSGVVSNTASLVSYAKQIAVNSLVAAVDSTANAQLNQVVGNKQDHSRSGVVGNTASLVSYAKQLVVNSLVAAVDSTANAQLNQVVGNKADHNRTGAVSDTASLISYAKQIATLSVAVDSYQVVATADTSDNAYARDVVGNKEDAARSGVVGTTASLVAYAKQIVTNSLVAAADSTANAQLNQVVGNKEDHSRSGVVGTTASLVSYAKQLVVNSLVAAVDSTANAQLNQVVGNKGDHNRSGVVGTTASLVSYAKQLVTNSLVAAADSSANAQMNQVVGNKEDAQRDGVVGTTASMVSYLKQLVATGDSLHVDGANYLTVTADGTSATWNTAAAHEIADVTGLVEITIIPVINTSLTGAGSNLSLGTENATSAFIDDTSAIELDDGEIWWSATAGDNVARLRSHDVISHMKYVVNNEDIGYTVGTNAFGTGEIIFHMFWTPLNATGAVVAGAGGVF